MRSIFCGVEHMWVCGVTCGDVCVIEESLSWYGYFYLRVYIIICISSRYEFNYHVYCEHVALAHTHTVLWQVSLCWSRIGSVTASPKGESRWCCFGVERSDGGG